MTNSSAELSRRDRFRLLPPDEQRRRLAGMTRKQLEALLFDWGWLARPSQMLPTHNPRTPDGSWTTWMAMAGRGWGKTTTGAQTVRHWVKSYARVNIIVPTAGDIEKVLIEGAGGIMNVCPKAERPRWIGNKSLFRWPNGATSFAFSAEEPDRLRGPEHEKLWCDELAAWRYAQETWDMAMMGLRLGNCPQALVTTTPRPTAMVRALAKDPTTILTRGTTYDNRANLAKTFLDKVITKYEGTRLGRQELNGEILEDNPGALWTRANIDTNRVIKLPPLRRIVVAADPAVTSNADSDETGIIVAGIGMESPAHFYVLDDLSLSATPDGWARELVMAYLRQGADRIVGEVNNGGDLVETIIRHVEIDGKKVGLNASYKAVHASRGKAIRAEPISALYEQNRVHHVGSFPVLEDQLCDWDPAISTDSPDRLDALVWALTELAGDPAGPIKINRDLLTRMRR